MQGAARAETAAVGEEQPWPRTRAPLWTLLACVVAGMLVPLAVFAARRSGAIGWLWSLPSQPDSKVAWGLAAALSGVALLFCAQALLARLRRDAAPRQRALLRVATGASFALVVLAAGALLLRWHYLGAAGDWTRWVRWAQDPFLMPSEALGRWSHYVGYEVASRLDLPRRLRVGPKALGMRLASVAAGMFYLAALLALLPRALPGSARWSSALFLFVSPTAVLFAGYLETTPWGYAFLGTYLLAGLRYLAQGHAARRAPWPEALVLMLAVWSHGAACFATGAHLFLTLHWLFADGAGRSPWTAARLAQLAGVCALPFAALAGGMLFAYVAGTGVRWVDWYGNALGGGDGVFWVLFSPEGRTREHQLLFLGPEHLVAQANVWLRAFPLFSLLPVAVGQVLRVRARRAELAFLLAGLAGLLLLGLLFNPDLGAQRDFDLLALWAVPAGYVVALWWDACFGPRQREVLAAGVAAATFAFVLAPELRFP
jgi:hypothetical protein